MAKRALSRSQEQAVHKRHRAGDSQSAIAYRMNVNPNTVRRCIERLEAYEKGFRESPYAIAETPAQMVARYVPTEEEIAAACLDIQKTWTPAEERRRRVCSPSELDVTTVVFAPRGRRVMRQELAKR